MRARMNLQEIEGVLREAAESCDGEDGAWEFELQGVRMACLTDTHFDRVRVIAPVVELEEMSDEQRDAVLEANFHTALDARYATSDGVLYAAFLHPLAELSADLLRSGIEQVVNLVATFGTSYSGGTVVFGHPSDRDGRELN